MPGFVVGGELSSILFVPRSNHADLHPLQERYLAKVKALLHQELSAENGDAAPLLRASNGCSKNGAYGSDEDSERAGPDGEEDSAMEMEEAAASSSSSTPMPRARKARRSRSNGESKSNGSALAAA